MVYTIEISESLANVYVDIFIKRNKFGEWERVKEKSGKKSAKCTHSHINKQWPIVRSLVLLQ